MVEAQMLHALCWIEKITVLKVSQIKTDIEAKTWI